MERCMWKVGVVRVVLGCGEGRERRTMSREGRCSLGLVEELFVYLKA